MPQGEAFWNPYRMIPVRNTISKKAPLTDEKFKGKSGILSCSLENLTPLFIGKNRYNSQKFLTRDGNYVIPGSSIKGMLRSIAELVGGGCLVTDPKGRYSLQNKACDDSRKLCIACRMFGMMERDRGARVHKGNISIGDALLQEERPETILFEVLLANCGVRHEPFYRTPQAGTLDGKSYKFYFHQPKRIDSIPKVPPNLKSRAWNIDALTPGHHFDFKVQFSNLHDEELELLAYVLDLEEKVGVKIGDNQLKLQGPLRHKIGNAKPLGLGSCHLIVERLVYHASPQKRFASLKETGDQIYDGKLLRDEINKLKEKFINDSAETMQQFRKMMIWDENDPRNFRYPDWHWFQESASANKVLKKI